MNKRKTISRSSLEELAEWAKKEKKSAWQWYEDETSARYGAWDNPSDRSLLMSIKSRATTLGSFADYIREYILDGCSESIKARLFKQKLMEWAKKQESSSSGKKLAKLVIKSLKRGVFPDEDDLKEAF